eukprot:CAMPEP_0184483116 /NCGR_PEP_ID=MMETSP0113_2-20130426/4735_1 /TAXON_ID=91329 /ORGANISM="Norrisiella sphaerica, Strain BC52" /LENGTH=637 /DNA_ID=CAMNT_0026863301 /DNA_START=74 /DNA_END=1987 /DNA_ORIENTATION=+
MSDVKDILGLSHATPQPAPTKSVSKKAVNPLTKGLAREVRNLLDDNNGPGIGIALQAQQFKAKRSRKTSWKLERIKSSARRAVTGKMKDDLEIYHWVKIHNLPDYRFAKWNRELKMMQYTDEEYEKHLKDPGWSKAETDKLFDLCRRFDLRFLIIHDRFNPIFNSLEVPDIPHGTHEGFAFAAPQIQQEDGFYSPTGKSSLAHTSTSQGCQMDSVHLQARPQSATSTKSTNVKETSPSPAIKIECKDGIHHMPNADLKYHEATAPHSTSANGKNEPHEPSKGGDGLDKQATKESGTSSSAVRTEITELHSKILDDPKKEVNPSDQRNRDLVQNSRKGSEGKIENNSHCATENEAIKDEMQNPKDYKEYRTIEELKSRYYCCQKLLLKARHNGREEELQMHPLFQNNYDGEHERTRREQLELLLRRTGQQEKQISAKVAETREIDKKIRRVRKQLDALKKNPRAALGMIQRARAKAIGGSGRRTGPILRRGAKAVFPPADAPMAPIPKDCQPQSMFQDRQPGISLGSVQPTLAPNLRGRVYKQLESELLELGFNYASPRPFKVPSFKVCKKYDELRRYLVSLINLNKHVQEREKERDRLRAALRAQNKSTGKINNGTSSKRDSSQSLSGSSSKRQKKA